MGLFKRGGRGKPAGVQGGWNAAAGDQGGDRDAPPTVQDGFLPASVGIQTRGDVFTPLLAKGSLLPAARTEIFTTSDLNQAAIKITAFQGEHARATKNVALGVYEVTGFAPAKPGKPQIHVTFQVDTDGLLSVLAIDRASGRVLPVSRSE
jgi:molecular chaperone DnaK (HSP70)